MVNHQAYTIDKLTENLRGLSYEAKDVIYQKMQKDS